MDDTNITSVKKKDPEPPLQLFMLLPLNLVKAANNPPIVAVGQKKHNKSYLSILRGIAIAQNLRSKS